MKKLIISVFLLLVMIVPARAERTVKVADEPTRWVFMYQFTGEPEHARGFRYQFIPVLKTEAANLAAARQLADSRVQGIKKPQQ